MTLSSKLAQRAFKMLAVVSAAAVIIWTTYNWEDVDEEWQNINDNWEG